MGAGALGAVRKHSKLQCLPVNAFLWIVEVGKTHYGYFGLLSPGFILTRWKQVTAFNETLGSVAIELHLQSAVCSHELTDCTFEVNTSIRGGTSTE